MSYLQIKLVTVYLCIVILSQNSNIMSRLSRHETGYEW